MTPIGLLRAAPLAPGDADALLGEAREAEKAGAWTDALERYESALTLVARAGDARRCAEILRWIGTLHRERGDLELADDVYGASLAIAEANALPDQVASALNCLAAVAQFDGRPRVAEDLYLRARAEAERASDPRLIAIVEQNLGSLANIRGDVATALTSYRSALEAAERAGDDRAVTAALNNMGMAYVDLDELESAQRCFSQAFEHAHRGRDLFALAYIQVNRAELHLKRQQFEHARHCCDDSFSVFTRLDSKTGLAEVYKFYGMIYRETGKPHLADIHLNLSLQLAAEASNRLLQAEVQHELALAHQEERRFRDAIRSLNQAHRLFTEMQASREIVDIEKQLVALELSYLRVVNRWGTDAIESKDPYTLGHSRRVADYARRLAEAVGIGGHDLCWIQVGAFLHDVGKTVVPPSMLTKPGALNSDEMGVMRRHTIVGSQIVADLDLPYAVGPMVRGHHERWDGRGYPDGLAAEEIPLTARILSVADVYDALTSRRSYRDALDPVSARQVMRREAGKALDPTLVPLFEDILATWSTSA
ncbi:MAG: HD domain-containing phosphohydrolase [Longimicrobiales bacterium]